MGLSCNFTDTIYWVSSKLLEESCFANLMNASQSGLLLAEKRQLKNYWSGVCCVGVCVTEYGLPMYCFCLLWAFHKRWPKKTSSHQLLFIFCCAVNLAKSSYLKSVRMTWLRMHFWSDFIRHVSSSRIIWNGDL